jgi:hypothetical protein
MSGLIDGYLAELRRELWSRSPFKERLIREIEDHLRDAVEREHERGVPPEQAEQRAIERFGQPQLLAPLLVADLAVDGRRTMRGGLMEQAQRAMRRADEEARQRGQTHLGTEHLLLGLLQEEESCAVIVLQRLGIEPESIRAELEARMAPRTGRSGEGPWIIPSWQRAFDLAHEEAEAFDLYYTSTEHLLLGLIREGEGLAAQVLLELGADLERTRAKVGEVFAQWTEIAAVQQARREARERLEKTEAEYQALLARL